MTNVKASELNYDSYTSSKYDQDIVNSIPYHKEIHENFLEFIEKEYSSKENYKLLDLGVGTGITSRMVKDVFSNTTLDVVDFSEQMLDGAREKLQDEATYILADYSEYDFSSDNYDVVYSFIGLHHQNTKESFEGSKKMFTKIYKILKSGGCFVLGDLMTYRDPYEAAINDAKHYALLVEKATDERTLREWAHHHMFLNNLAPIEDLVEWLEEVGFEVKKAFHTLNTGLLICRKK